MLLLLSSAGMAKPLPAVTRIAAPIQALPGFFAGPVGEGAYVGDTHRTQVVLDRTGARFSSAMGGVRIDFQGATSPLTIEGCEAGSGSLNLFHGSRDGWRSDLKNYACVRYRELYPGIDLVYRFSGSQLKSEFLIAAGADPSVIRLRYSGGTRVAVDRAGSLVISTAAGEYREEAPYNYQEIGRDRFVVSGRHRLFGTGGSVGFEIGEYDKAHPLVIDPAISFSTFLGGAGFDSANAIAVDAAGNIYVAGWTESYDLPVNGALQRSTRGGLDGFVAKLDPGGSRVLYCTYLGGSGEDRVTGIAVDSGGHVYVAGLTASADFPVTGGAMQPRSGGGRDAFVARIDSSGSRLLYSTFLGGSGQETATGIAVDSAGNAFISGATTSDNFPVYRPTQSVKRGQQDAFVAQVNAAGSAMLFSTYLGGMGDDRANAIAVDSATRIYIAGDATSPNFPTVNAFQAATGGNQDAFVAKLDPATGTLLYSTYLGGNGGVAGLPETATAIDVDSSGSAYVAGVTSSADFPVSNPYQSRSRTLLNAFLVKIAPGGNGLAYGTYLGGSALSVANAVRVDPSGKACVAGYTASADFPVVGPVQQANAADYDAFLTCFTPDGKNLDFSTYLGGSASDAAYGIGLAGTSIYVAGQTTSQDFPLKNGTQDWNGGSFGGFVTQLQNGEPSGGPPTDDVFVRSVYLDLLGRAPDAAGLAFWASELKAGRITRSELAYAFFTSAEFKDTGLFVISAYRVVLGRDPDVGGWLFYMNELRAGLLRQRLIDEFIQSAEFQSSYGSLDNAGFVTRVYLNVLGRNPDAGGLAYYTGLLGSGALTRAQIMLQFAVSAEFQAKIQNRALTTLLYMGLLRRSPERAGADYWTSVLDAGASPSDVLNGFITSTEYLARF